MIGDPSTVSRLPAGPASTGKQRRWWHRETAGGGVVGGSSSDTKPACSAVRIRCAPTRDSRTASSLAVASSGCALRTVTVSRA